MTTDTGKQRERWIQTIFCVLIVFWEGVAGINANAGVFHDDDRHDHKPLVQTQPWSLGVSGEIPDEISLKNVLDQVKNDLHEANETGSAELIRKAERRLWAAGVLKKNAPASLRILLAYVYLADHDFLGALGIFDKVLEARPNHVQALFSRAVIRMMQGNLSLAGQDCAQLYLAGAEIQSQLCKLDVESRQGKLALSYARLQQFEDGSSLTVQGLRQWYLELLAHMAWRLGKEETAENHFQSAMALSNENHHLLASYGDFLLSRGKAQAVLDLLAGHADTDALLLLQALAHQQLKHPQAYSQARNLALRFRQQAEHGDNIHLRELARFHLDLQGDERKALVLALENWERQKEPQDALLVLRAAAQSGQPRAARGVLTWLDVTRLEDARIEALRARYFHSS